MKTKLHLSLLGLWLISCLPASAGTTSANEDLVFRKPLTYKQWQALGGVRAPQKDGLGPVNTVLFGQEKVVVAALCASGSTNLAQSQKNAMAGLVGIPVPIDRASDPAAWYVVDPTSWEWFDFVTTSFNSWMGTTVFTNAATSQEFGHRMVIHAAGLYPVSAYTCSIGSTSTNIQSLVFAVGTNTAGQEIPFNVNFVAIDAGSNGVLDSFYDYSLGQWVQAGDDRILSNGELPSTNTYTWWYRFGATASAAITNASGFNPIKAEFASSVQTFTTQLMHNGTVVSSVMLSEARPTLSFEPGGVMTVHGGQTGLAYELLSAPNITDTPIAWSIFYHQAVFSGQSFMVTNDPSTNMMFFRLEEVVSP